MRKFIVTILAIAVSLMLASDALAIQGRSMGYGWCTICGRDMPLSHDFTHGYSSGGSSGYSTYNDPFVEAMTPMLQSMFEQIGQDFAKSLFGDPAEQARQQAIREEQQRRQAEEAQLRAAELARQRQIAHDKLMKSLKLFGTTGGGLRLKSIADEGLDWDGRNNSSAPRLKGIADEQADAVDLRPAGTSFFGLGGGGQEQPMVHDDTSVVDLRDYRRASFLAHAANNAPPQDRSFLIDEAIRAADGDTSFVAEIPDGTPIIEDEDKFRAFQNANQNYRDAQHAVVAANGRLTLAERRASVAEEAVRRTENELKQLAEQGADAATIARKQQLLNEAQKALTFSRNELDTAKQEAEVAQNVNVMIGWGRRQEVVSLGSGQWEYLSDKEQASLSKLQRIYGRKTTPPPPEIPGWVARAEAGRRALGQIDRYEETIARCAPEDREVLEIQLDRVRHKAQMMDHYDHIINARTGERIEAMRQLQEIQLESNETMNNFFSEAIGTVESVIGDFRSASEVVLKDPALQGAAHLLDLNDKVESAKSIMSDISASRTLIETGQLDFDSKSKLIERANTLAVDITEDLDLLKKTDPELAKRLLGRTAFWIKAGHGMARTTNHTMDLLNLHQNAVFASDSLGDWAQESTQIKDIYQRQVDGFVQERAKLDGLLAATERTN